MNYEGIDLIQVSTPASGFYHIRDARVPESECLVAVFGKQDVLAKRLRMSGYKVVEVTEKAIDPNTLVSLQPNLAIVDWQTESSFGLETCSQLSGILPGLAIILITHDDCVQTRISGLNAGALSCVAKPYPMDELLARIRVYTRNSLPPNKTVFRCGSLVLNSSTREVYRDTRKVRLTAREFDLLKFLMMHKNQVVTRDRIVYHVWGYDFVGESNMIEVYISTLRRKLQRPNYEQLIHTVRMVGYVLKAAPSNN